MHKQRKPMASARSRNGQKEASRRGAPDARERVPTDAGGAIDCARYGYRNRRAPARAPSGEQALGFDVWLADGAAAGWIALPRDPVAAW